MKKLAFGALLVGLLVACGGNDGNNKKVVVPDSSTVDAPGVCNPLTQAGCAAGEKCTWLVDALMPQYVGHIGCAPDGTAAVGQSCMYGAPGTTGYDNCAKGSVCGNYRGGTGVCKQICDNQGGQPACDAQHVCVTYSGLFSTGTNTPPAGGVCDLACDPLKDNDFDGSASSTPDSAHVKRTNTCGSAANVGCYGYPSFGTPPATGWSCTGDINSDATGVGLRHRVQCTDANMCSDAGTIYVNSCNQGYLPLLRESTLVDTAICVALCKPAECYMGNCGNNDVNRAGAAGDACNTTDRAGTFQADTVAMRGPNVTPDFHTGGEHCHHLWDFEIDDMDKLLRSPTSDTVGFCLDHSKYMYDSNNDNTPDTNYPSCGLLKAGFGDPNQPATMPLARFGAAAFACQPSTAVGLVNGKQIPRELAEARRLLDLPRPLYHRTMGIR